MENYGYFLAAYIIVWMVIFAYIYGISIRQRNLRRDIDALKDELNNNQRK